MTWNATPRDEADVMFRLTQSIYLRLMIFMQIREVLRLTPRQRQTLLFSATMTEEVRDLAALSLQRPVRLAADAAGAAPKTLQQEVVRLKVRRSPGSCVFDCLSHTIAWMNSGISLDVLRCVCAKSVKCAGPGRLGCEGGHAAGPLLKILQAGSCAA